MANTHLIDRPIYSNFLSEFIDKPFVKIITGLRRSGKTELLNLIKARVLQSTDAEHVVSLNFEDIEYQDVVSFSELNALLMSKIKDDKTYYFFFDEIQEVKGWEKSINGLRLKNADIYITGSNSKLLSDEFGTLLGGRTVTFKIYTLSFAEFIEFRKTCGLSECRDIKAELAEFIRIGGFPALSILPYSPKAAGMVVDDILAKALFKDVVKRHKIKNAQLLDKIVDFVFDNVGNLLSIAAITKYMKSQKRSADPETVANYLKYLEDAHIVYRAQRYDITGKRLLETNDKYYLGDHSLGYARRERRKDKVQSVLENIVFMELKKRGYEVYVGTAASGKEVDFVADNKGEKVYIQVCMTYANSEETRMREFAPLLAIKDHYPKYVVTLDDYSYASTDGVKGISLADFLLKAQF